jgi:hypothetical protein
MANQTSFLTSEMFIIAIIKTRTMRQRVLGSWCPVRCRTHGSSGSSMERCWSLGRLGLKNLLFLHALAMKQPVHFRRHADPPLKGIIERALSPETAL